MKKTKPRSKSPITSHKRKPLDNPKKRVHFLIENAQERDIENQLNTDSNLECENDLGDIENQLDNVSPPSSYTYSPDIENQQGDYGIIQKKIFSEILRKQKEEEYNKYMYKPVGVPLHVPSQIEPPIHIISVNTPSDKNIVIGDGKYYGVYDTRFHGGIRKKNRTFRKRKSIKRKYIKRKSLKKT
jgi:copper chaperone CopZ